MRRDVLLGLTFGALCLTQPNAGAQQPAAPGVVVVSSNKCAFDAPARLDSISTRAFHPILNELVNEGRLLGWGVLGHAWGDEWNYVIYYTAANTAAFHSAFGEFARRLGERDPTFFGELSRLCTEHKDNIYSVMRLGDAPPAPR